MIIIKKIKADIYQLKRRKRLDEMIEVYEEAKASILDMEQSEGIKESYLSADMQLKRDIEDEYKQCIALRDKEIEAMKSQIDSMKAIEDKFNTLNANLKSLEAITKSKDDKIKNLETKIKQAGAIKQQSASNKDKK